VKTGECISIFKGHAGFVEDASFTNDSRHVVSGSRDGTIRFWNVETTEEIARCYGFDDGTWAIVAPDGRYDASNDGDCPHLSWIIGLSSYPVTHFKNRFYTPGLLPMLLGKADHNPVT
jgi:WD40 repeat protein